MVTCGLMIIVLVGLAAEVLGVGLISGILSVCAAVFCSNFGCTVDVPYKCCCLGITVMHWRSQWFDK